jgi:hypothetical protein
MSAATIGKVVVVAIGAGIMYAVGHLKGTHKGKAAREVLAKENEEMRTLMRAWFATFETTNAAMEAALADVIADPPLNAKDLESRFKSCGVPQDQIDRILADLVLMGILKSGAA